MNLPISEFKDPVYELFKAELDVRHIESDAYLKEAAMLPESQQGPLLDKAESLLEEEERFAKLLRKLKARNIAVMQKEIGERRQLARLVVTSATEL
jgi:hypothetical protein